MRLLSRFAKATNRIAHDILHSRGFEPRGEDRVSLLAKGRKHNVLPNQKVRSTPIELANHHLQDIVEATKDTAIPKVTMLVREMQRLLAPHHPQQELQPARVRQEQPKNNRTRH